MLTDATRRVAGMFGGQAELDLGKPVLQPTERYKAFPFGKKNFKKIEPIKGRVAFLDGGNLPLIETPSFAVHFDRVYFNLFENNERVQMGLPSKIEFFVVLSSSTISGEIEYKTDLFTLNEENKKFLPDEKDLVVNSFDESLRTGKERIEISRVGDIARSFSEWNYARFVIENLRAGDVFVRDGTLHAPYTNQSKYAEEAYKAAKANDVGFVGVSKTCHLYTSTGLPLVAAIARLARENNMCAPWYYEKIVEITDPAHKADLNFVKLNQDSKYVHRVEILQGQECQKAKIFGILASNACDISFPGYPYGLVEADKNARVSYRELEPLKMLLLSEISKTRNLDEFKEFLAASDAHDWLNKVV